MTLPFGCWGVWASWALLLPFPPGTYMGSNGPEAALGFPGPLGDKEDTSKTNALRRPPVSMHSAALVLSAGKAKRAELLPMPPIREKVCPGPSLTLPRPEGTSDPALG